MARVLIILLIIASFLLNIYFIVDKIKTRAKDYYTVTRVIDGDTFYCQFQTDREIEKIKLIGIEIPELLGERATEFTKSYLRRGIPVKLERDAEGRDSHGRVLAYIYIPGDEMLNALLIQEGYARVMIVQPNFKYKDLFLNLQKQAKEQGKGLWGK